MSSSQILAEISVNLTAKTGPVSLKASEVSPSDLAALSRFRLLMAFSNSLRVGRLTLICHSSCLEIMGNSSVAENQLKCFLKCSTYRSDFLECER